MRPYVVKSNHKANVSLCDNCSCSGVCKAYLRGKKVYYCSKRLKDEKEANNFE